MKLKLKKNGFFDDLEGLNSQRGDRVNTDKVGEGKHLLL